MKRGIILFAFVTACNTSKDKLTMREEKIWTEGYKSTVLCACLTTSYGKSYEALLQNDQSVGANFEILGAQYTEKARYTGAAFAKNIVTYPANTDLAGKRNTLNTCLYFYSSKELDLAARQAFKQYTKDYTAAPQ